MATAGMKSKTESVNKLDEILHQEESSESEAETEPAKSFHRRISTNKGIKTSKCLKDGYLLKQTSSFQRWRRRYFKLKARRLYYAKTTKSVIFDEIELIDCSVAECSTKNVNHSFQVITPFRNLVLCADSRKEMENWIHALKSAASREFYEPNTDQREMLSGQHNWYACSHARPTYCNVCREALSGVTSHGLSCEVCKFKAHKRCAVRATNNCKWTTLASIGQDIIEEEGSIFMPHQWMEGNLPVSAKCSDCDKTCGSVLRLQDWRCLWCKATIHTACQGSFHKKCPLGQCRVSILPPTAISNLDSDGFWRATKLPGTSPLLVFVNSKSGDNQGVKIMRRFKQLLNPAQVFDLINGGPRIGLRLFQSFESFRVLVCGGDGSIGWVLSEIDKLGLHKQCQIGVLPLGTGNDLARVLGWGAAFDDDTQLPLVLEKMEHAQIKMLDRWSIMVYEGTVPTQRKMSQQCHPILQYEDSVATHLSKILHSDNHAVVISSAKVLCETVKDFVANVGKNVKDVDAAEDSISQKCVFLNEKLDALLKTLNEEAQATSSLSQLDLPLEENIPDKPYERIPCPVDVPDNSLLDLFPPVPATEPIPIPGQSRKDLDLDSGPTSPDINVTTEFTLGSPPDADTVPDNIVPPRRTRSAVFKPRDQLMSRANSLKKAIRQIIEQTEKAVDEQNGLHGDQPVNPPLPPCVFVEPPATPDRGLPKVDETPRAEFKITYEEDELQEIDPCDVTLEAAAAKPVPAMATLTVPYLSDGDSSACTTPGSLSPPGGSSPQLIRSGFSADLPKSTRLRAGSASRQISKLSTYIQSGFSLHREKSPIKESPPTFPLLGSPVFPMLPGSSSGIAGSIAGGSFISKVLLANADALCAAASPLMQEDIDIDVYEEKCVMNNYFGIGVDAKIALDFHTKREEHPEKCRSRTKNMMWYGVIGGKELVNRTYRNLDRRVQLECDGHRIPLPNLQGIVVLNIPSYMGGANFWGGTKEDDNFMAPSFDDKVLEVVAVFGSVQLGISKVINLQRHRIAQCRSVKITILGEEGVAVQVDGEAWLQSPGYIKIVHKNRAQMLTRDKVFEEALKTWTDKQKIERPVSPSACQTLSLEETQILHSFVESTEMLIKSVKVASICHSAVEHELFYLATQASGFLDRLYPAGTLAEPAIRTQVSDLVSSVRTLYNETNLFIAEKASSLNLKPDVEERLSMALAAMDVEMQKVYEIGGLPHFQAIEEEATELHQKRSKEKSKFSLMSRLMKSRGKDKEKEARYMGPNVLAVLEWSPEDVAQWLECLGLGEYKERFISHDIRGLELLSLGRTDLKELGVSKVGHLKRIQHCIKEMRQRVTAMEKTTVL